MKRREILFVSFMLLTVVVFWKPLEALVSLSLNNDAYSHMALIPLASIILFYFERKRIFASVGFRLKIGMPIIAAGLAGAYAASELVFLSDKSTQLALIVAFLCVIWVGGFVSCYGMRAFHAAAFPLLFLLLMIPLPDFLLNKVVFALQKGSTIATYAIFRLVGVPVLRQGFVFSLPTVNIEVARECSGIRSSMALLITSLLAGHLFLRSNARKLFFSVMTVPITIFKNAVRIATISLLSVYVNRGFLTGNLHRHGGIPFSILAVSILVPLLWWLQRSEIRSGKALAPTQHAVPVASSAN